MKVKTQERWTAGGRRKTTHCESPACSNPTREGKPYCSDHVELHPYVRDLLRKLQAKEDEEAHVGRVGARAVDPEGLTSQEILLFLKVHGARTVQRLARELNIDARTLNGYVRALKRRKLVRTSPARRGGSIVRLPGQPLPESARKRAAKAAKKQQEVVEVAEVAVADPQAVENGDANGTAAA